MSGSVTDVCMLGVLEVGLIRADCDFCHEHGRAVAFADDGEYGVLASVGIGCGCWDKFLRLVTDSMVGAE